MKIWTLLQIEGKPSRFGLGQVIGLFSDSEKAVQALENKHLRAGDDGEDLPFLKFERCRTEGQMILIGSELGQFVIDCWELNRAFMDGQWTILDNDLKVYKKLTITAANEKTKIWVADLEGNLVQTETGKMETSLRVGAYKVHFGVKSEAKEIQLDEDMVIHE